MANILLETRAKTLTENLYGKVLQGIVNKDNTGRMATQWWTDHKVELVGLGVAQVITLLTESQQRKNLAAHYDQIVASMTWKEKIAFLNLNLEELKELNNKKFQAASLVVSLLQAAPKVIAVILMVI